MRFVTFMAFVVVSIWVLPVHAEEGKEGEGCAHRWSAGVGFSLAKAEYHYEPFGELEMLFTLTCPVTSSWDWYVEGGIGATSGRAFMVPFGFGVLRPVSHELHIGFSVTWYTHVSPEFAGSALVGPLFEWEVTEQFGVIFVPGFVMHVNHAEKAYGWGTTLSLEL